jgi:hypothetical protein
MISSTTLIIKNIINNKNHNKGKTQRCRGFVVREERAFLRSYIQYSTVHEYGANS